MSIIYNGTNITNIIYNGTTIDSCNYNNTNVFSNDDGSILYNRGWTSKYFLAYCNTTSSGNIWYSNWSSTTDDSITANCINIGNSYKACYMSFECSITKGVEAYQCWQSMYTSSTANSYIYNRTHWGNDWIYGTQAFQSVIVQGSGSRTTADGDKYYFIRTDKEKDMGFMIPMCPCKLDDRIRIYLRFYDESTYTGHGYVDIFKITCSY